MYSRFWENDHFQACIAGTGSGTSLIYNGNIVERSKGFKLIGILCVLSTIELLCERTMLGSCMVCKLTSKNMRRSWFFYQWAQECSTNVSKCISLWHSSISLWDQCCQVCIKLIIWQNWQVVDVSQCVPLINIGKRIFVLATSEVKNL